MESDGTVREEGMGYRMAGEGRRAPESSKMKLREGGRTPVLAYSAEEWVGRSLINSSHPVQSFYYSTFAFNLSSTPLSLFFFFASPVQ